LVSDAARASATASARPSSEPSSPAPSSRPSSRLSSRPASGSSGSQSSSSASCAAHSRAPQHVAPRLRRTGRAWSALNALRQGRSAARAERGGAKWWREAAAPGGARRSPARRATSATAAPRGTAAPAGPAGSPSAAPGRTAQRAAARGLLVAERLARRARCTWPGACLLLTLATPGCAADLPHDLPSGSSHCCGLVKRLLNSACTACRRCKSRAPAARSAPAQHPGDAWHSLCDHFSNMGLSASASPLWWAGTLAGGTSLMGTREARALMGS